jgi:hypothetical protein
MAPMIAPKTTPTNKIRITIGEKVIDTAENISFSIGKPF